MIRQQWIAMLAKLTAPMDPTTAAAAFMAYLPMLARLPDAAFCEASLKAVARQCERVPTFGTLEKALDAWWKQHRPPVIELPPPEPPMRPPPSDAERAAASRTVGEVVAALHTVSEHKDGPSRPLRPVPPQLSRDVLDELYRRAGVKGPEVSTRSPLAAVIPIRASASRLHLK